MRPAAALPVAVVAAAIAGRGRRRGRAVGMPVVTAAIAALSAYNVTVTVDDAGVALSGLSSGNGQVVRIEVNVTHASNPNVDVTLSAYRTNY